MSHCTLVAHKFVSTISQCTCRGGVGNALAAAAWTMYLLRWREQLENRGHKFKARSNEDES